MEEVDSIILRRLVEIGCDFSDEVKSIKKLSPDDLADAVVRCLRVINPETPVSSSKLPANVAVRYRFATSLAAAVTALGYKGDIGYQMILYGNETDARRLLMFLIEKLPKEGVASTALSKSIISGIELVKRVASERLRHELQQPFSPWFCKSFESEVTNKIWRQPYAVGDISYEADGIVSISDVAANVRAFRHVPASVLALNTYLFSTDQSVNYPIPINDDASLVMHVQQTTERLSAASIARKVKPPLLPKPTSLIRKSVSDTPEPVETTNEKEVREATARDLEAKKESLANELATMDQDIEQKSSQVSKFQEMLQKITNAMRKIEEAFPSKQNEISQLRLMANLAPNVDDNVKQLKDYIEKSDSRLEKLAATRDDVCGPLIRKIAEIKQASLLKPESEQLSDEILALEYKATDITEEMSSKKGHLQTLQREFDKMQKDVNRAYYTKRILEIVANVNKQKQEIARVLDEIRSTQRDVNMLSGKLDRSFTATDELLYKDATRDDFIKRAYKCFVSLHENCASIVAHIESAGHLEREMRDLDDKISLETQRSVDATLETLVNDYCEMKSANDDLFAKLKQFGIQV